MSVTNNCSIVVPTRANNQRGLLKQQDTIDSGYFHQHNHTDLYNNHEALDTDYTKLEDDYLDQQESVESYTEEIGVINSNNNKAINRDSPASVIHVERYDDEQSLRRGSSQITVVDPYHPSLKNSSIDPYAPNSASRRPSLDPYRPVTPTRRISGELYPNDEHQYTSSPPRKTSVIDAYQPGLQRRPSFRLSPPQPQESTDIVSPHQEESVPEKKNVSFEEEQEPAPRPQVTAQQRWHWAYNKIIMQLNVSRFCVIVFL